MSYEEIDLILQELEKNHAKNRDDKAIPTEYVPDIGDIKKSTKKNVKRLLGLIERNRHKHEVPPICKLIRD